MLFLATPIWASAATPSISDIAYGQDSAQRFDVYIPGNARNAPVIFMVHGGAWLHVDKTSRDFVANKAGLWLPTGFIVVSANYRLSGNPIGEAKDIARAIGKAEQLAPSWGGDSSRFILIGHSAGAHLVALLEADPSIADGIVKKPWLGAISLDSAALDVPSIMTRRHPRLYDRAFGKDREFWRKASPFDEIREKLRPILLVCSKKRDDSCLQAHRFSAKARSLGTDAPVLEVPFTHMGVDRALGENRDFTQAVEAFMGRLDDRVKKLLDAKR